MGRLAVCVVPSSYIKCYIEDVWQDNSLEAFMNSSMYRNLTITALLMALAIMILL